MNKQENVEWVDRRRPDNGSALAKGWRVVRPTAEVTSYPSASPASPWVFPTAEDPGSHLSLFNRLSRRKMCRWMLAYLAVSWLFLQLTDVLSDIWSWSTLAQQTISVGLVLCVFPAAVVAWYHGEKGRQQVCRAEVAIIAAMILGVVFTLRALHLGPPW